MISAPELDQLILLALDEGASSLVQLSAKIKQDARFVLRRLHVMSSSNQVQCVGEDGALVWCLLKRPKILPSARPSTIPAVHAEEPPCVPLSDPIPQGTICERVAAGFAQGESLTLSEIAQRFPELKHEQVKKALRILAGRGLANVEGWARGARWTLIDSATKKAETVSRLDIAETHEPAVDAPAPPEKTKRMRNKTIVVRQAVQITELSVTPMNGSDCLICDGEKVEVGAVGGPCAVFVPAKDIPALIDALKQLLAAAA